MKKYFISLISLGLAFGTSNLAAQQDNTNDEFLNVNVGSSSWKNIETPGYFYGNVGITKQNPKRNLHIQGVKLHQGIIGFPFDQNAAGIRIDYANSNSFYNGELPGGFPIPTPSLTDITLLTSWDLLAKSNRFSIDNLQAEQAKEYFTIMTNGDIGLSHSSPSASLHILREGSASIWLQGLGTTFDSHIVGGNGWGGPLSQQHDVIMRTLGAARNMIFNTGSVTPADGFSERFLFTTNDDVLMEIRDDGEVVVTDELKVGSLSGSGIRMVVAQAGGKLATQSIPTPTGDDLGNHIATQTLDLNNHFLDFGSGPTLSNFGFTLICSQDFEADEIFYNTLTQLSDQRLKKEIKPLENATQILKKVGTYTYLFDHDKYTGLNLPEGKRFGVMAQELQTYLPEFVSQRTVEHKYSNGNQAIVEEIEVLGVNYVEFIPLLIEANNEQQAEIESLKDDLEELKSLLAEHNQGQDNSIGIGKERSSNTLGQLFANVPNPYSETTTIHYEVNETASQAAIKIFDLQGNEIKYQSIEPNGKGSFIFNGSNLQPGPYVYLLTVNNQDIDTKLMMISR